MPSIQANISSVWYARIKRSFTLQLSELGGSAGTVAKMRFRLSDTYTSPNSTDIQVRAVAKEGAYIASPTTVGVVNPTNPQTGVTITSIGSDTISVLTATEATIVGVIDNITGLNGRDLIVELLTSSDVVLDSVVIPIRSATSLAQPRGLRAGVNEATAISNYVTTAQDALDRLTASQKGSIRVFITKDSAPLIIQYTDPISVEGEFAARALSATEISQPLQLEVSFRASVLTQAFADLLRSLERDSIRRGEPLYEVQLVGNRSLQVLRNCTFTLQVGLNYNAGEPNADSNFMGGRFKCNLTSNEFLLGFYEE